MLKGVSWVIGGRQVILCRALWAMVGGFPSIKVGNYWNVLAGERHDLHFWKITVGGLCVYGGGGGMQSWKQGDLLGSHCSGPEES